MQVEGGPPPPLQCLEIEINRDAIQSNRFFKGTSRHWDKAVLQCITEQEHVTGDRVAQKSCGQVRRFKKTGLGQAHFGFDKSFHGGLRDLRIGVRNELSRCRRKIVNHRV